MPYSDYENRIANSQDLAKAMKLQSLKPIENTGTAGSHLSWTQVLAKALEGYQSGAAEKEANTLSAELKEKKARDTSEGMASLMAGMNGPNSRETLVNSLSHPSSTVRSTAKELLKGKMTEKDLAKHGTSESVVNAYKSGNINDIIGKNKISTIAPGQVSINEAGQITNPTVQEGAEPKFENINGDLYQVSATGKKKLDNAPRISNTSIVNMPVGETEFEKKFGGNQGEALSKFVETRDNNVSTVNSVRRGLELLDKGIHSGALAPIAQGIDKASIAVFKTDPTKAANTEEFVSTIAPQVLGALQMMGGQDSNTDRDYLEKAMGGKITAELSTLKAILKRTDSKMRQYLKSGDTAIENYRGRGKTLPTIEGTALSQPENVYETPPAKETTKQTPMSLDAYLKSKGY